MGTYRFYYDESEHSRIINLNTFNAQNYYDNFVAGIIGWSNDNEADVYNRYLEFERKYECRKSHGELKSTTISNKQLDYGFASLNKQNTTFLCDFLSLFDDKILVYFSVASKMEHIITQLFSGYQNDIIFDMDAMKYSIIKAIMMYRPELVINSAFNYPKDLVSELKKFFTERIEKNRCHQELKVQENETFKCVLHILDDVNPRITNNWNYCIPFWGFDQYLQEKSIEDYTLTIDKEGEKDSKSNTLLAARRSGINNVNEADSLECVGIRMTDILIGIIGKMLKSLNRASRYTSEEETLRKKLLSAEWFKLKPEQLLLYKKLHYIVCQLNNAWYKSYSGIYSDDLVELIALLNYMSHFSSIEEIDDKEMQGEYFNAYCCECLSQRFERLHNKLPLKFVTHKSTDYFINHRGARVYFDIQKQPHLPVVEGENVYYILSVGMDSKMNPLITAQNGSEVICYRLPDLLADWAIEIVAFANKGINLFPAQVVFTKANGKIYADIQ